MKIPGFLNHLPVFSGFPVAYIVCWLDGKPDFRVIDQAKAVECYQQKLCAICGRRMFQFWFIGGPASIESGMFTDGPMHKVCAEFSRQACPFLAGVRTETNERPVKEAGCPIVKSSYVPKERPERMALRRASKYTIGKLPDEMFVYQVTKWSGSPIWF